MDIQSIFSYLSRKRIPILGGIVWRLRKLILPGREVLVQIAGTQNQIVINPRSYMGTHIYLLGKWESEVSDFVLTLSNKRKIVDIGAHIGYYSILFTNIISQGGKIISFEPGHAARKKLIQNVNFYKDTSKVESNAISDRAATLFLKGDKVVSGLNDDYDEKVESIMLDAYFDKNQLNGLDLIKIDIEGHEFAALKGMRKVLKEYQPDILLEVHPSNLKLHGSSETEVIDFLGGFNYQLKLLYKESEDNYMMYCSKIKN